MSHIIFVYGTLMKGESNHFYIENQQYLGKAAIHGYNLYNLGHYPGIRPSKHNTRTVYGELYSIDDNALKEVNRLEGEGSLYLLQHTEAQTENGETMTAGIYVYNHETNEEKLIEGGDWQSKIS